MTLTDLKRRRKGRPSIEEIPLPPHVQRALVLRGNGSSWKDAAESVGMDYRTLKKMHEIILMQLNSWNVKRKTH